MKAVIQRVREASVTVDGRVVGQIGSGLAVLLGVVQGDTQAQADILAKKIVELRIFTDEQDKMNRSLLDIGGQALVVSQFTLAADCSHGRRPSFTLAARPEQARALYESFVSRVQQLCG
ncbi:MAG: D-aminoacyl-tRNA deacylase, partial [Christensenellaceae bacterium]